MSIWSSTVGLRMEKMVRPVALHEFRPVIEKRALGDAWRTQGILTSKKGLVFFLVIGQW
jgi:hypothetical protein